MGKRNRKIWKNTKRYLRDYYHAVRSRLKSVVDWWEERELQRRLRRGGRSPRYTA
jgi:hypothetical protein